MTPHMLAQRLERLANSAEELCEELAERSHKLIQDGFRMETDPYGMPWAPRKDQKYKGGKRTGHKILQDTLQFKSGFVTAGVNKSGFTITNDTPYGGFHQHGTRYMAQRSVVPRTGEGLGTWQEPLAEVARAFIRKKLL
jgi:phage gpG-like protein